MLHWELDFPVLKYFGNLDIWYFCPIPPKGLVFFSLSLQPSHYLFSLSSMENLVLHILQTYHYSTPCSKVHWNSHCEPQLHHTLPSEHLGPVETRQEIRKHHGPCLSFLFLAPLFFTLSFPAPTPHSATLRSKLQSNLRSSAIKTDPLTGAEGGGAMGLQAFSG